MNPITRTLKRFQYLWATNPLWLAGLPGIPDPRVNPHQALAAAQALAR